MTTAEILREAKALIDTPEKWTRETLARFGNNAAGVEDKRAYRFCALGAVLKVTDSPFPESQKSRAAVDALREAMGEWPANYNDDHSHADVMAAFDRAIEATS